MGKEVLEWGEGRSEEGLAHRGFMSLASPRVWKRTGVVWYKGEMSIIEFNDSEIGEGKGIHFPIENNKLLKNKHLEHKCTWFSRTQNFWLTKDTVWRAEYYFSATVGKFYWAPWQWYWGTEFQCCHWNTPGLPRSRVQACISQICTVRVVLSNDSMT